MTCGCGGELFQFTAPDTLRVPTHRLPAVCQRCGLVKLAGEAVPLPESFAGPAASMATQAKEAAQGAKDALMADPEDRIQKYFENVYTEGYLGGFFRALAFYKYVVKEGRLARLRELWETQTKTPTGTFESEDWYLTVFPEDAREEFEKLLYLGDPRGKCGQGTENKNPSGQTSPASV